MEEGQLPSRTDQRSAAKDTDSPEHTVSVLISLPHLDNSVISNNSLLHQVTLAIELPNLALLARNLNFSSLSALRGILVLDGDLSSLNGGSIAGGSVKGGDTCSSCSAALGEGALGSELESDLTVEVEGFEVLW